MKIFPLTLLAIKLISVYAQEETAPTEPTEEEGKGAASARPEGFGGVYELTFYHNRTEAPEKMSGPLLGQPLACSKAAPIRFELDEDSPTIVIENSESKPDPIYNTKLATWDLRQIENQGDELQTLFKFFTWEGDSKQLEACWRVGYSQTTKDDLVFAITPGQGKTCPHKYSNSYTTCTPGLNFAYAKCLEGACKDRNKAEETNSNSNNGMSLSLPLVSSLLIPMMFLLLQ